MPTGRYASAARVIASFARAHVTAPSSSTTVVSSTCWPLSVTPGTEALSGTGSRHSISRSSAGCGAALAGANCAAPVYFVPGCTT